MKRFNRARLTSPEPAFFLPFKSNKVSDSVFLFSTFFLSQTGAGLNYNLRFPINIVKLGTLKEKYQNDSIKGKTKHGTVLVFFPHYRVKL